MRKPPVVMTSKRQFLCCGPVYICAAVSIKSAPAYLALALCVMMLSLLMLAFLFTKAALNILTQCHALEFGPKVRVNVITPGSFLTDVAGEWRDRKDLTDRIALGRFGQAHEIVSTALYLASDSASYTTAANIRVDGCSF